MKLALSNFRKGNFAVTMDSWTANVDARNPESTGPDYLKSTKLASGVHRLQSSASLQSYSPTLVTDGLAMVLL